MSVSANCHNYTNRQRSNLLCISHLATVWSGRVDKLREHCPLAETRTCLHTAHHTGQCLAITTKLPWLASIMLPCPVILCLHCLDHRSGAKIRGNSEEWRTVQGWRMDDEAGVHRWKIMIHYLSRSVGISPWTGHCQVYSRWQLPWHHSSATHIYADMYTMTPIHLLHYHTSNPHPQLSWNPLTPMSPTGFLLPLWFNTRSKDQCLILEQARQHHYVWRDWKRWMVLTFWVFGRGHINIMRKDLN